MQVFEVDIPNYSVDEAPDDRAIGKILDDTLKKHFMGKQILVRGVASSEHSDKNIDQLIELIGQTGTDRYDPERAGDRYENVEGKHIDLFAFPALVTPSTIISHAIIYGFYHSAIGVHGKPMRIDIITIYDATQMQQVLHRYAGRDDIKDDGYVFKDPKRKESALLGIIKIN